MDSDSDSPITTSNEREDSSESRAAYGDEDTTVEYVRVSDSTETPTTVETATHTTTRSDNYPDDDDDTRAQAIDNENVDDNDNTDPGDVDFDNDVDIPMIFEEPILGHEFSDHQRNLSTNDEVADLESDCQVPPDLLLTPTNMYTDWDYNYEDIYEYDKQCKAAGERRTVRRRIYKGSHDNKPYSYSSMTMQNILHRENDLISRRPSNFHSLMFQYQNNIEALVKSMTLAKSIRRRVVQTPFSLDIERSLIDQLDFNKMGNIIAANSAGGEIILWDWELGRTNYNYNITGSRKPTFYNTDGLAFHVEDRICDIKINENRYRFLYEHERLTDYVINPAENEIMSVGIDGEIFRKDLRSNIREELLFQLRRDDDLVPVHLFTIAHHPTAKEICVGSENGLHVFDLRNPAQFVSKLHPDSVYDELANVNPCELQYNHLGDEILISYNLDHTYIFKNRPHEFQFVKCYKPFDGVMEKNCNNHACFFGQNSEFIVGGNKYGNIYFWNTETTAITNVLNGRFRVDYVKTHPLQPVVASCGYGRICMWTPERQVAELDIENLKKQVIHNVERNSHVKVDGYEHDNEDSDDRDDDDVVL